MTFLLKVSHCSLVYRFMLICKEYEKNIFVFIRCNRYVASVV